MYYSLYYLLHEGRGRICPLDGLEMSHIEHVYECRSLH